ncbi:MAG: hypothetical protein P8R37_03175 [Opitutae bacterium]|nr:hypothetical protein [Opitutae bacterium]
MESSTYPHFSMCYASSANPLVEKTDHEVELEESMKVETYDEARVSTIFG